MAEQSSMRAIRSIIAKRKFPTLRRQRRWHAQYKFDQLVHELRPGDIVLDCGANVGKVTKILAGTGATVYVFEPDPYCFEILRAAYGSAANVHLSNKAVGVANGTTNFFRAPDFASNPRMLSLSSSVYSSKKNIDPLSTMIVEQIDLIEFVQQLPQEVKLLKMDIEGAEVPILEALIDTGVIAKIAHIFTETHERTIADLANRTHALRARVSREKRININLDWK